MKNFAVSYINWFDNNLKTKFVKAGSWQDALFLSDFYNKDEMEYILSATTFEDSKQKAFDTDSMFEVVEFV